MLDLYIKKKFRGSVLITTVVVVAILCGFIGLSISKLLNTGTKAFSVTNINSQAMQYALNEADLCRARKYSELNSLARQAVAGTGFEKRIIVSTDASAEIKTAVVDIFEGSSAFPVASITVKKPRINDVLYDSPGDNTDGAMTQKAATDYFALKDSVFTKDEAYSIFITQSRAEALLKALEDSIADNYLTKEQAQNIYRTISDSYSKGETDSLLNALRRQVDVNRANIATNSSNISNITTRLKNVEDALDLYLKITDAADIYLTKAVAASTYAEKTTAVTHMANAAAGNASRPVYINSNGVATALTGTVGSETEPVYLKNGVFTPVTLPKIEYCTDTPSTSSTASSDKPCVIVQNYSNGTEWYRVYSDGFCEQGGYIGTENYGSYVGIVNMPIAYKDINYTINTVAEGPSYGSTGVCSHWFPISGTKTVSSFRLNNCSHFNGTYWETRGYIR